MISPLVNYGMVSKLSQVTPELEALYVVTPVRRHLISWDSLSKKVVHYIYFCFSCVILLLQVESQDPTASRNYRE